MIGPLTRVQEAQRQAEYQHWLDGIEADHPGCTVDCTPEGANVIDGDGEIVTEYDYEPRCARRAEAMTWY